MSCQVARQPRTALHHCNRGFWLRNVRLGNKLGERIKFVVEQCFAGWIGANIDSTRIGRGVRAKRWIEKNEQSGVGETRRNGGDGDG